MTGLAFFIEAVCYWNILHLSQTFDLSHHLQIKLTRITMATNETD